MTLGFVKGSFWHIICVVWWRPCGSRWGLWRCFGTLLPVLFMLGVWKCCHDTWLCTRIILTYHMWGLVEVMWVQMRALEMVGTFIPVLFMIGVWKCHLDTCLHISELLKAVEWFIFIVSCVWQSMSHKIWCPKVLLPLKFKILILRPIVRAPQSSWLLVLKSFRS